LYSTNGEVIWFHDAFGGEPLTQDSQFSYAGRFGRVLGREFNAECDRLPALPNDHGNLNLG